MQNNEEVPFELPFFLDQLTVSTRCKYFDAIDQSSVSRPKASLSEFTNDVIRTFSLASNEATIIPR